jgi:hypothetical protein
VLCAYLTERADRGVSLSTIHQACSAIGYQHRQLGLPYPLDHQTVRQVRRGLRRLLGTAPRRPARPLSTEDLRQIITRIDRTTAKGARDTAVILLGFAGALTLADLHAAASSLAWAPAGGQRGYLQLSEASIRSDHGRRAIRRCTY